MEINLMDSKIIFDEFIWLFVSKLLVCWGDASAGWWLQNPKGHIGMNFQVHFWQSYWESDDDLRWIKSDTYREKWEMRTKSYRSFLWRLDYHSSTLNFSCFKSSNCRRLDLQSSSCMTSCRLCCCFQPFLSSFSACNFKINEEKESKWKRENFSSTLMSFACLSHVSVVVWREEQKKTKRM